MIRVSVDLDDVLYENFSLKCLKAKKARAEIARKLIEKWVKGLIDIN